MTQSIVVDGRRLIAPCDSALDEAARSTLRTLASLHGRKPALHSESVIMFGWSPIKVLDDGIDWILYEPDFTQAELKWVRGINKTLEVLDQQASVVHALGAAPRQTRYDEFVLVESGAELAPTVFLERVEPRLVRDSGWYAGVFRDRVDKVDVEATSIPAGRLLAMSPHWMPFLALPPGFFVLFSDARPVEIVGAEGQQCPVPPWLKDARPWSPRNPG